MNKMSKRKVAVIFGSSSPKKGDEAYKRSEDLGKFLSKKGFVVRNGGYSGTMEGSAKGCKESGGEVEGCIVSKTFTSRPKGNQYLTKALDHKSLCDRLDTLTASDVQFYIILPGNIGTLNELCLILCLKYIGIRKSNVYVWKTPFEKAVDVFVETGICEKKHKAMLTFVKDKEDLKKLIEKNEL